MDILTAIVKTLDNWMILEKNGLDHMVGLEEHKWNIGVEIYTEI